MASSARFAFSIPTIEGARLATPHAGGARAPSPANLCAIRRIPFGESSPLSHTRCFLAATSNRELADEIAKRLKMHVGKALVDRFKNEECAIEIGENVRGAEVFVIQSICKAADGRIASTTRSWNCC